MKRERHTEEQINCDPEGARDWGEDGRSVPTHGIREASFSGWKAKYSGLEVSEAKRLKGLESENARPKKLLADTMLDNAALQDLLAKNGDARCQTGSRRSPAFSVRDE